MKRNILYTNINKDTDEGRQDIYKLVKAKNTTRVSDSIGLILDIDKFVIFERINDDDDRAVICVFTTCDGSIYGTTSGSFIDEITDYLDNFPADSLKKIKIGKSRSRAGRDFITVDIL